MTVSDYIFDFLIKKGVNNAFVVTGGQAMYLNDALARRKEIKSIFTHHEQTCSMSADAYSRITKKLGLAVVTAGPGAINAINGLVGGWCDSAPMMIISGQSALKCVEYQQQSGIRQFGIQGIFIKPFVEKATKYFVTVDDPAKIKYYMEKAYHSATTGRPGPVWIDVPLDVQKMEVPQNLLTGYEEKQIIPGLDFEARQKAIAQTVQMLKAAQRPLIVAGQGISLSKSEALLKTLIETLDIPLVTTRLGIDIIETAHPLYVGRPGNYGERSANLAVQNADLILAIGTRLATAAVGHASKDFGRNAQKIIVDIDPKELEKPVFDISTKINDDANLFIQALLKACPQPMQHTEWVALCQKWKANYPVVLAEYGQDQKINSYYFTERLCSAADAGSAVLVDTGSCFHVAAQVWKVKKGQKFLTTGGLSSMGYWVAGIGACVANDYKDTIVITGDGSLQMNIQEFATIKHNKLPIKVFIYNNDGYLLIRQTQNNFMEGRLFGEGPTTGVWCPDAIKIAQAYGIKAVSIDNTSDIDAKIKEVLDYNGPVICDVKMQPWQLIVPRVSSEKMADGTLKPRKFEDMFPYLPLQELKDNMVAEK